MYRTDLQDLLPVSSRYADRPLPLGSRMADLQHFIFMLEYMHAIMLSQHPPTGCRLLRHERRHGSLHHQLHCPPGVVEASRIQNARTRQMGRGIHEKRMLANLPRIRHIFRILCCLRGGLLVIFLFPKLFFTQFAIADTLASFDTCVRQSFYLHLSSITSYHLFYKVSQRIRRLPVKP